MTKDTEYDLTREFGASDWYNWSIINWGTKWNAYDVNYFPHNENAFVVTFDTAWSPPDAVFEALRTQGFDVDGFWHEEGGETGDIGNSDGVYVSTTYEVEFE